MTARRAADYEPMCYRLRQLLPSADPISLNLAHTGRFGVGLHWEHGERLRRPRPRRHRCADAGGQVFDDSAGPYTGRYHVGTIEASPLATGRLGADRFRHTTQEAM